ncbi:prefoldin subunit 5 isoform X1 [Pteropus medius]|uniref:Prefoldin subunit 5 n=1 Tax=Pteropus vampyrus TaxID=132908 RepID=A0A6P6BN31_PTEVA|nr:prefoldin subunit 5 isoform X1 [Pteropus vampyrus]XP_039718130.1 prefoldin subunit 5 isoform X1 [Pteropus giganteus]
MAQSVNITELNLPQLEMLKNQLDQEVEFLSTSIAQLKVVQTKYVEAKDCLNVLNKSNEGKELLVPLTSSMYVPGKLHDVEHVLIDVGTGYYVEKTAEDAKDFFKRKIDFLTKQMEKIQPALQEKHAMKQGKLGLGHLFTLCASMIKNVDCSVNPGTLDQSLTVFFSTAVMEMMSQKIQQLTALGATQAAKA